MATRYRKGKRTGRKRTGRRRSVNKRSGLRRTLRRRGGKFSVISSISENNSILPGLVPSIKALNEHI